MIKNSCLWRVWGSRHFHTLNTWSVTFVQLFREQFVNIYQTLYYSYPWPKISTALHPDKLGDVWGNRLTRMFLITLCILIIINRPNLDIHQQGNDSTDTTRTLCSQQELKKKICMSSIRKKDIHLESTLIQDPTDCPIAAKPNCLPRSPTFWKNCHTSQRESLFLIIL